MSSFLDLYDEARRRGHRVQVVTMPLEDGAPRVVAAIGVSGLNPSALVDAECPSLRDALDEAAVSLRGALEW